MKKDLATSIALAIVGTVIGYLVCNLFIGEIEPVSFSTVEGVSIDLDAPDPEVFNYRALNPTVEVYVGECVEYNTNGECVEQVNYGPNATVYTTRNVASSSESGSREDDNGSSN